MKNVILISRTALTFIAIFFTAISSFAQQALTDTLPESAYHDINVPKHVTNIYSGFVPYVLFGIVGALILFVGFRLWWDNTEHTHTPHHS